MPTAHTIPLLLATGASLTATPLYGYGAAYTQRYCANIAPSMIATGSQATSTLVLAPIAIMHWPESWPTATAWYAVTGLAMLSTACAFVLYFRLIARLGSARAITVTFLTPAFGMVWGALWLSEPITWTMLGASAVILTGTALATGTLRWSKAAAQ